MEIILENDLTRNILIAHQFLGETNLTPDLILNYAHNIKKIFPNADTKKVLKGIYKGYSGFYGKTYKLTMQEICVWIRCELNDCMPNELGKVKKKDMVKEMKKGNHVNH